MVWGCRWGCGWRRGVWRWYMGSLWVVRGWHGGGKRAV